MGGNNCLDGGEQKARRKETTTSMEWNNRFDGGEQPSEQRGTTTENITRNTKKTSRTKRLCGTNFLEQKEHILQNKEHQTIY
jgi:thiamine biosynthesis protein ThiC